MPPWNAQSHHKLHIQVGNVKTLQRRETLITPIPQSYMHVVMLADLTFLIAPLHAQAHHQPHIPIKHEQNNRNLYQPPAIPGTCQTRVVRYADLTLFAPQNLAQGSLKFDMGMRFGSGCIPNLGVMWVEIDEIVSSLQSCPGGWPAVDFGCWTICPLALFSAGSQQKKVAKKGGQKKEAQ